MPDDGGPDGGMPQGDPSDVWLPDGVFVNGPLAGHVLLSQNRGILASIELTNWRADVWMNDPPRVPISVSMIGACRMLTPGAGRGRSLDAGNLTLAGTPYGSKVIAFDPLAQTYDLAVDDEDTTDGALFTESSMLQLSAAGGADIQTIRPLGAWRGVTTLVMRQPRELPTLPAADLPLSWVPAPRDDTSMEVSLRSPTVRIDCPVPTDSGAYTVKKAVLDALPAGPIYLFIHRLSTVQASTTPDRGPILLESVAADQKARLRPADRTDLRALPDLALASVAYSTSSNAPGGRGPSSSSGTSSSSAVQGASSCRAGGRRRTAPFAMHSASRPMTRCAPIWSSSAS